MPAYRESGILARVRLEHILFGLVLVLAGAVRLTGLANPPLSPAEADEALAVWDFWQPSDAAPAVGSPAYFSLTSLIAAPLGISDPVVRLVPALFGLGLVLLPWLLRHRLGRMGALVSSLLLAVSPLHSLSSRSAGGQTIALFAGLLLFSAWIRYQETQERRWFFSLMAALSLGLASGALFYSMLVTLFLAGLAQQVIGPSLFNADAEEHVPLLIRPQPAVWRQGGLLALGVFLALSSLFLWHLDGIGAAASQLAEWLGRFDQQTDLATWLSPVIAIARYDLILLILGGSAVLWATWHGRPFPSMLLYWLVGIILLLLIQRGQMANLLVLSLVGYLLIGRFFEDLIDAHRSRYKWPLMAAVIFCGGIFYFNLVRYSRLSAFDSPTATYNQLLVGVAVGLAITLLAFVWNWNRVVAIQSAFGGLLVLLLLFAWGTAWWLSQNSANDTRERWVDTASDDELPLLVTTIRQVSYQTTRSERDLEILSTVDSPALRWYLRDFPNLTIGGALPRTIDNQALITPMTTAPALENGYLGADFGLSRYETEQVLDFSQALQWWLFRYSPVVVNEERVIFWLRADLAGGFAG